MSNPRCSSRIAAERLAHQPKCSWSKSEVPTAAFVRITVGSLTRTPRVWVVRYPIYRIHITLAAWFVCASGFTRPFTTFFLSAFAATVALSWLIVVLIDRPLSRLKRKLPAHVVEAR
ncbi:hypothetical protein W7K_20460 [Stenotrophomonas geniculata N1]|uniref:Uncharacterized protein n=1 Tax=Stenotrophomonas geniculata N1 TaxID=1167641 RepID=A0A0L8A4J2_9GAMM|nr:hypothetical protein W7K_20460 [Stenotrophomonas geniculata N1]